MAVAIAVNVDLEKHSGEGHRESQRFAAAFLAISFRRSGTKVRRPLLAAKLSGPALVSSLRSSSISPAAILATMIARETASGGALLPPRGPLGAEHLLKLDDIGPFKLRHYRHQKGVCPAGLC